MKTSKINFTILLFLCFSFVAVGQQTEKTVVKAFNLQGNSILHLQLNGQVEVKEWDQAFTRVQLTIQLENGSDVMLKSLVKVGRYNMKGVSAADTFIISMPNVKKQVSVGGNPLIEHYQFVVYAPATVSVTTDEATVGINK